MKKKSLPLDAAVAIALIAIIVLLSFEGFVRQDMPDLAARFPLAVFGIVVLAGIAEVVRSISANKQKAGATTGGKEKTAEQKNHARNFAVISIMIVIYSILMYLVGFIASSILFFIVFVLFFKFKRIVLFTVCSAIGIVGVYFCFTEFMHIRLPIGELFEMILYY